ncbi:MAG: O-antigen ligase family protein [Candidatus Cloacimonetes bacterium]|nr:O-antigen ligase family protein [Candidatus Cloacimonadota bacterium]
MKKNDIYVLQELQKIIGLISLLAVAVYWFNPIIRLFIYTIIFAVYYFSRNNVFWLSLFFILISAPFDLFYGRFSWFILLTSNVGVPFSVLFYIISYIKVQRISMVNNSFKSYYHYISIYILFLIVIGLIFGPNQASLFRMIIVLPNFTVFIFLPQLLDKEIKIVKFNKIVLSFSIVIAIFSIIQIILPYNLLKIITNSKDAFIIDHGVMRQTGGIFICLYSFVLSLYYLNLNMKHFTKKFLYIVIFSSLFFIFNSATRGWILASIFILFLYFLFFKTKSLKLIFTIAMFGVIVILYTPKEVKQNITKSYKRLATISNLTEGDLTADGTLSRLTVRSPKVMNKYIESPIIGFGYSKVTENYHDKHVGNQSLLLSGGILGFLLMYGVLIAICKKIVFFGRIYFKTKNLFIIFIIGIFGILIIHSSSMQMFGFYMDARAAFLISAILTNFNILMNQYNRRQNNL